MYFLCLLGLRPLSLYAQGRLFLNRSKCYHRRRTQLKYYLAAFPYPGNLYTYSHCSTLLSQLNSSLCNHSNSISLNGFSRYFAINSACSQLSNSTTRYLGPHHSQRCIFHTSKRKQKSLVRQRRHLIKK